MQTVQPVGQTRLSLLFLFIRLLLTRGTFALSTRTLRARPIETSIPRRLSEKFVKCKSVKRKCAKRKFAVRTRRLQKHASNARRLWFCRDFLRELCSPLSFAQRNRSKPIDPNGRLLLGDVFDELTRKSAATRCIRRCFTR